MSKPRLFNRPFFKNTALGRTISGRNKSGQTLGIVKDVALSFVPVIGKPIKEITGTVTDDLEAAEIGKRVDQLNLSEKTVKWLRIGVAGGLGYYLVKAAVDGTLLQVLSTMKPIVEFLQSLGVV
ncbi:MAG: hypothetical protein ABJI69_09245 [Balneola sp.]